MAYRRLAAIAPAKWPSGFRPTCHACWRKSNSAVI